MIEQTGEVARVEDGRAWIACRPAECRACAEGRGCGAGVFASLLDRRGRTIIVDARGPLRPGDRVILGLDERGLLGAAFQLYGLPLAGLMLGVLAGAVLGSPDNDFAVLVGGLTGLAGFLFLQRRVRALMPRPELLRRATSDDV